MTPQGSATAMACSLGQASPVLVLAVMALLIPALAALAWHLQRRFRQHRHRQRQAIANLCPAQLSRIGTDPFALSGQVHDRAYTLFSYSQGRGGIWFAIDIALAQPVQGRLLIISGQADPQHRLDARHAQFWQHFRVQQAGTAALQRLAEDPMVMTPLLAAYRHAPAIRLDICNQRLRYEQLERDTWSAQEMADLIDALAKLARHCEAGT